MSDGWLSNTYLVAGEAGGDAFFVDAGGPVEPLIAKADEHDLNVTHVLLTHHHGDHVAELDQLKQRWPDAEVLIHPEERGDVPGATGDLLPDQELEIGGLTVKALHTPGHTAGMLSLLVGGTDVFTGDTLFKGSVGGVRAPGSTRLRRPQALDHGGPARAAARDDDPAGPHRPDHGRRRARDATGSSGSGAARTARTAASAPRWARQATLVLLGDDYDGGHKAWVRWPDGRDDIVPGSQVSLA